MIFVLQSTETHFFAEFG